LGKLTCQPVRLEAVAGGTVCRGTQQLQIRSRRWQNQLTPLNRQQPPAQFSEGKH